MKQILTIKGRLPSMNEIIRANRGTKGGFIAGAEQKRIFTTVVCRQAVAQRLKPFKCRIDVSFMWTVKDMRRDKDNIMAGQKFIFDGLVLAGVIRNDGWKEIGRIRHDFKLGDDECVLVTMEEDI